MDIRTGHHVVYLLHAHMVFVTKLRGKVPPPNLARLEEIFRAACAVFEVTLEEFNESDQSIC
jgi:putative transposase